MSICLVCQLPDRTPERGQVCEPDRARIGRNLRDIGDLYQRIELQPGRTGAGTRPTGKPGSRMPLAVDPLDLTMPGRALSLAIVDSDSYPRALQLADQVGHISVASVLDSWVRDWCDMRREHLPVPTVAVLVGWLLPRVGWACDEHAAVDEFAGEIRHLHSTLRAVCGLTEPKPQRLDMPCPSCDLQALHRTVGDAYPIRCVNPDCRRAFSDDEYEQVLKIYAEAAKRDPQSLEMIAVWRVSDGKKDRVTVS